MGKSNISSKIGRGSKKAAAPGMGRYALGAGVVVLLGLALSSLLSYRYGRYLDGWEHKCSACKAMAGASVVSSNRLWSAAWGRTQARGGHPGDVQLGAADVLERMCEPRYFKAYFKAMDFKVDGKKPGKALAAEFAAACQHWTTSHDAVYETFMVELANPSDQQTGGIGRAALTREGPICFQTGLCGKDEIRKKLALIAARRKAGKVSHPMAHSKK